MARSRGQKRNSGCLETCALEFQSLRWRAPRFLAGHAYMPKAENGKTQANDFDTVGLVLDTNHNGELVVRAVSSSASAMTSQNILPGDTILQIGNVSEASYTLTKAARALSGAVGRTKAAALSQKPGANDCYGNRRSDTLTHAEKRIRSSGFRSPRSARFFLLTYLDESPGKAPPDLRRSLAIDSCACKVGSVLAAKAFTSALAPPWDSS